MRRSRTQEYHFPKKHLYPVVSFRLKDGDDLQSHLEFLKKDIHTHVHLLNPFTAPSVSFSVSPVDNEPSYDDIETETPTPPSEKEVNMPDGEEDDDDVPVAPAAEDVVPVAPAAEDVVPVAPAAEDVVPVAPAAEDDVPVAPAAEDVPPTLPVSPPVTYVAGVYRVSIHPTKNTVCLWYVPDVTQYVFEKNIYYIEDTLLYAHEPSMNHRHRKDILLQYCSRACFNNTEHIATLADRMRHVKLPPTRGSLTSFSDSNNPDCLRHVFMYYMVMFQLYNFSNTGDMTHDTFDPAKISEDSSHKRGGASMTTERIIILLIYYFKVLTDEERSASYLFPVSIDMQAYVHVHALVQGSKAEEEARKARSAFHTSLNAFIQQTEHTDARVKRGVAIATVPNHAILFVFEKDSRTLEMHNSNGEGQHYGGKNVKRSPEAYFKQNIALIQSICEKQNNKTPFRIWISPDNVQRGAESCGIWQIVRAMYRLKGIPLEHMPSTEKDIQHCAACIFEHVRERCLSSILSQQPVDPTISNMYTVCLNIATALSICDVRGCPELQKYDTM
jgi:hypothetical protein